MCQVIQWDSTLRIPREAALSLAASDLILRLCCSPEHRLGCGSAVDVKTHTFFTGINFAGLRQQEAPYRPTIRYATDTSNFDTEEAGSEAGPAEAAAENGATNNAGQEFFAEFTFRRFFDDRGHPVATKMIDDVDVDDDDGSPQDQAVYV